MVVGEGGLVFYRRKKITVRGSVVVDAKTTNKEDL
jgi:hypothetical protein